MKKFVSLLMALALAFSLTACGKDNVPQMAETTEPPAATETIAPTETEAPTIPPEEVFAAVGTLQINQLTDSKAMSHVYKIEDGKELSREIDLSVLPEDLRAAAAEEVRYIVHFKYCAKESSLYTGSLRVYNCSITAEILDAFSGEVIAEESFGGPKLPDTVVSDTGKYYGEYPDEAEVESWVEQTIKGDLAARPAAALLKAQQTIDAGNWSYNKLLWLLTESDQANFTMEEAQYALDNCEADWFAEALEYARVYIGEGYGKEDVELFLNRREFTPEQVAYALEKCG